MAGLLAAYCLVMIAPALVLLVLRLLAHARIEPMLQRINDWMVRTGQENTAWIIGFLVAANALGVLGVLKQIDEWSKK